MPEKTSTSSPNSRRRCSECGPEACAARLVCPADLPGLTLCLIHKSALAQPRHAHDSFIVGVVTAGVRRIETARGKVLVRAGEVFALPPGLAHLCAPEHGLCSYLAFSLEASALPERLRNSTRMPLCIEDTELTRALLHLAEACETQAGRLERQSLLACVLERLGDQAKPGGARRGAEEANWAQAVRKAMDIIEADAEQALSLPELATACGADMYALHRAFTRLVGLPPHAFQTHRRLRRAKALLRAGASLTDAALAAGFCDQSHMHRHFTRLVGFTPAQYACAHKARSERS
jgi:AraC-like DNA-binding protein